jgi:ketosteroid isomerase-like protein
MTRADVQVVHDFFAAWPSGESDPSAFREVLDRMTTEDLVYVEDPQWPGATSYEGRDAVAACWERYDEVLGGRPSAEIVEVREAGTRVVATVRIRGESRGLEVPFDHTWGYACEVRDGRISYFRAYLDPDRAIAEAEAE